MGELSSKEIDALLKKIREEYKFFANENPKMFRLLPFEERYTETLRVHGNLERFFSDEIKFLEQMKKIHQENKARIEIRKNSTIDRIIEDQESSMRNYRKIDFHPYGRNDLKYFYGAMIDYVEIDLLALNRIFKGTPEIRALQDPILQIERIGLVNRSAPSTKIFEHIKTINAFKGNHSKIEQETQNIIKDTCIALRHVDTVLKETLEKKHVNVNKELAIEDKDTDTFKAIFGGLNFGMAITRIIEKGAQIVRDFRMDGLLDMRKPNS